MNTRKKGNRVRLNARKILEQQGYLVDISEKTGKFIRQKDLFGVADLVAIKDSTVKFIQVTTNRPHTHKNYQEFVDNWGINLEQWVWLDRKYWKIFTYEKHKVYKVDKVYKV